MAYDIDKKTGEITFGGWEQGIAPSPHKGAGDLKNVNISSINGEVSVAYSRARLDQVPLTSQSATLTSGVVDIGYTGTIKPGTWILLSAVTGATNFTVDDYYQVVAVNAGVSIQLSATFGGTAITPNAGGSITFSTLPMGAPVSWCAEASVPNYRYYILDQNGVVWVSQWGSTPTTAFQTGNVMDSSMYWSAITPYGANATPTGHAYSQGNSIQIIYGTTGGTSYTVSASYLMIMTDGEILYGSTANGAGWPSLGTAWSSLSISGSAFNFTNGSYHKSIVGIDNNLYITDGNGINVLYQTAVGTPLNPGSDLTFTYTRNNYIVNITDSLSAITMSPTGGGLSVIAGGQSNLLYFFPVLAAANTGTGSLPTTTLWMPESGTVKLLPTNNYVTIFTGNKGNIYITNGSSVVPLMTVPDYVAGSASFVQDPFYEWGDAAYLRGRIFFSIKDSTSSHTGNCGGVWSFAPSFAYFINQDSGLALRMEGASSAGGSYTQAQGRYNGYAPVLFGGLELNAQAADGPQYLAAWTQDLNGTTVNSIDFSGTAALTNGISVVETDAVYAGTFIEPRTFSQIEVNFTSALVSGESVVVNYRTDLEAAWKTAGTISSESFGTGDGATLSQIIQGLSFQQVQLLQLQAVLTSVANGSWCRFTTIKIR